MLKTRQLLKCLILFFIFCLAGNLAWRHIFPYVPYCIRYPDVDTFSSQKEKFIDQKNYNDLYIITYANKVFFNRLKNLVGSVHYWEPELRIIVYDLGMCQSQIEDIKSWRNS